MQIILKDMKDGTRVDFPMIPENVQVDTATQFFSYNIMNTGEVRLPSGEALRKFSWSGTLPGKRRKKSPYVHKWKSPKQIQSIFGHFRKKKRKLRLMVTGTPINHNVYLESYTMTYAGGYGDYQYQISFVHAKSIKISTKEAKRKTKSQTRPTKPMPETYTVKKGDTLYGIAEKMLGAGNRYAEIFALNKSVLAHTNAALKIGSKLLLPTSEDLYDD